MLVTSAWRANALTPCSRSFATRSKPSPVASVEMDSHHLGPVHGRREGEGLPDAAVASRAGDEHALAGEGAPGGLREPEVVDGRGECHVSSPHVRVRRSGSRRPRTAATKDHPGPAAGQFLRLSEVLPLGCCGNQSGDALPTAPGSRSRDRRASAASHHHPTPASSAGTTSNPSSTALSRMRSSKVRNCSPPTRPRITRAVAM